MLKRATARLPRRFCKQSFFSPYTFPTLTLLVDCTGDGLRHQAATPIFCGDKITLQSVVTCQQVFSAALIGRIETLADLDDDDKNELATVIPHPDTPHDYLTGSAAHIHNVGRWMARPEVAVWLAESRLSPTGGEAPDLGVAIAAVTNLDRFIAEADTPA